MSRSMRQDEIRKRRFWRRHIKRQSESGLSKLAYCRENSLKENQFHYWQRRLADLSVNQEEGALSNEEQDIFVPVSLRSPYELPWAENKLQTSFQSPPSRAASVEIFCPQGYVVRIASGGSAEIVSEIVEALSKLQC